MNLTIHVLRALKDNFMYALVRGSECAIIDPGDATPVRVFLQQHGLQLKAILCTHHHPDHIQGATELQQQFRCEVWSSSVDQARIPGVTKVVHQGSSNELLGERVEILEIPGHTMGQLAYWLPKTNALFPGDTLFSCGCGRLFEGSPAQMFASMEKIRQLPPNTQIYFGHEYTLNNIAFLLAHAPSEALHQYQADCLAVIASGRDTTPTTIAVELALNPFLNSKTMAEFTQWRQLRDQW